MKNYIVYDNKGEILRSGCCQDNVLLQQAQEGEFVIEGTANDIACKIVDGKVVDKTPEEIEAQKPPIPEPIPYEKQLASITNEQYQTILGRLANLEKRGIG